MSIPGGVGNAIRVLKIKRVYEPPAAEDGYRILVDRIWPRGITKAKADIKEWRRDLAPSTDLRKWYGHDPDKWDEFRRRYRAELEAAGKISDIREIADMARSQDVTLVFGARDPFHNQAVAVKEIALGR